MSLVTKSVQLVPLLLNGSTARVPPPSLVPPALAPAEPWPSSPPPPSKDGWRRLNIGAGGYVTGIDIAPDGTKVARCDSSGAYIWREGRWVPLLTTRSMPAGQWGRETGGAGGVFEIAIAPSRTTTIYVCVSNRVYRTDDAGGSFALTALQPIYADSSSNNGFKMMGRMMAVDPGDPLTVVVGAQEGSSWLTRDGGATWSALPTPAPASRSGVRVAFDPKTRRLYLHSDGAGVFASNDQGRSFAPLAGGPPAARHMAVDRAGVVWVTDTAGALWGYRKGGWSQATSGDLKTIAVDPVRDGHLVAGTMGGSVHHSFDGGETWTGSLGVPTRQAADIPWLAWTNEAYMASGDMRFDRDGSLWFAEGIGVWRASLSDRPDPVVFQSRSLGIEQLTSNSIVVPPGGAPLYLAWDRPVFRLADLTRFPARHGPSAQTSIVMGWSADYAPENPKFVVALMNWNGVELTSSSSDGGESWTQLPSVPDELKAGNKIGGAIAVASRTNYVIAPNNNGTPWVTADGGKSWARCAMPGVPPPGGETGWGTAYYFHRHIVVADKAMPGTFYAYNYRSGWYRSIDAGATWALVHPAFEGGQWTTYHARVGAVPGHAGHLFFTPGTQQGAGESAVMFQRSRDGGKTWTRVDRFWEVHAFGFGAPAPGAAYPAIYAAGFLDSKFGIYRSDDDAKHWIALGDYPLAIGDEITWVAGDPDHYGRVYVAFGGSGAAYRELSA